MKVVVKPLIGETLSSMISATYGPILGMREADIMDFCQQVGEIYVGFVDGRMECCWGLIPPSFLSMQAYLWMWQPKDVVEHQFLFVRHSQMQVQEMLRKYESIIGHCKANPNVIKWLRWLGAEFAERPNEDGNIPFTIRRREDG